VSVTEGAFRREPLSWGVVDRGANVSVSDISPRAYRCNRPFGATAGAISVCWWGGGDVLQNVPVRFQAGHRREGAIRPAIGELFQTVCTFAAEFDDSGGAWCKSWRAAQAGGAHTALGQLIQRRSVRRNKGNRGGLRAGDRCREPSSRLTVGMLPFIE